MSTVDTGDVEVVDLSDDDGSGAVGATRAPRERRPVPVLAVIGIVVAIAIVAATVAGGLLTRRDAAAATVGTHRISVHDLEREVRAFADNSKLSAANRQQVLAAPHLVSASFTAGWLENMIVGAVVHDEVTRRHLSVPSGEVAQRVASLTRNNPGFPRWFIEVVARRSAEQQALGTALGSSDPSGALLAAVRREHVTVDPRFGTLDVTVRTGRLVLPPKAPEVKYDRRTPTSAAPNPLGG